MYLPLVKTQFLKPNLPNRAVDLLVLITSFGLESATFSTSLPLKQVNTLE